MYMYVIMKCCKINFYNNIFSFYFFKNINGLKNFLIKIKYKSDEFFISKQNKYSNKLKILEI